MVSNDVEAGIAVRYVSIDARHFVMKIGELTTIVRHRGSRSDQASLAT